MSVILEWTQSGSIIEEPLDNIASTTYTLKLKNSGTNVAQQVGFYLQPASLEGSVEAPSTDGILNDWHDVLTKGSAGGSPLPGFHIIQGMSDIRFSFDLGNNAENPIPLSIGSGVDSDQLGLDEEVTIQFKYVPQVGDPTRRLYVQVALTYTEV